MLEELLRGSIAGLPELVEPKQSQSSVDAADVPDDLAWATTEYLYDITQEYYQVISETTTSGEGIAATTAYAYGLERIAAYAENSKTHYVYDGRGSVAQAISAPVAGETVSVALPDVAVKVHTFSYTAFGEQLGVQKVSGFGYNGEEYDAATGLINLRVRQYEPALNRFSQEDALRGNRYIPLSLSRYLYVRNSAVMCFDPSGMETVVTARDQNIQKILEKAEAAINLSNDPTVSELDRIKEIANIYREMADIVESNMDDVPAELVRMMNEAKRALKDVEEKKSPGKEYLDNQIHIDACELAMILIDNGFDEYDFINRAFMNEHFLRLGKTMDWSKDPFTPGYADASELIAPYVMLASAKFMYDMGWRYDPKNAMKPGSVVCDSFLRVIAKLHFTGVGYNYHENKGNLKTTPQYVYDASKKGVRGAIFNGDKLSSYAEAYMTMGSAALRIYKDTSENHIGIVGEIYESRSDEKIGVVYHAANKKDNMKIDYINLSTKKQYFNPQYDSKNKQASRKNTTWNKFVRLTYVNYN